MRRSLLIPLALAVVLPAAPAYADDVFFGEPCDLDWYAVQGESTASAFVDGGPYVVVPEAPDVPVLSTTIVCSIQDASHDSYDDPDLFTFTATADGGVVHLTPQVFELTADPVRFVTLCTEFRWTTSRGTYVARKDYYHNEAGTQCFAFTAEGEFPNSRDFHSNRLWYG